MANYGNCVLNALPVLEDSVFSATSAGSPRESNTS